MAYQSKYTGLQIDDILDSVEWKQGKIEDLASIRAGAQKGATALQSYTEKYTGTVTGIKLNGTTKNPSSGVVDLGTVITSHQDISGKQDKLVSGTSIKTINGTSLLGSGNIEIESGGEANVQSDWLENDLTSDTFIRNKTHNLEGLTITKAGSYSVSTNNNRVYFAGTKKIYTLSIGVRTQINSGPPIYVTLDSGGILIVEDSGNYLANFPLVSISSITPLDDMFIPETIARTSELKTINGESILGSGDLTIEGGAKIYTWSPTVTSVEDTQISGTFAEEEYYNILNADILYVNVDGQPIFCIARGINSENGEGIHITGSQIRTYANFAIDIFLIKGDGVFTGTLSEPIPSKTSQLTNDSNFISSDELKTINGQSIVGSGNITIEGGSGGNYVEKGVLGDTTVAYIQGFDTGNMVYGLPDADANGDADDYLVSINTLKTINGESILGSGNIEISGGSGGEDIRYFTEFTVEDFIEACENYAVISEDATELHNAMKSNKIICVPYRLHDKGFHVASYKTDDAGSTYMYLQKRGVEYVAWIGTEYELYGESPVYENVRVVEMAGGDVALECYDNHIYIITDPVDYLLPILGTIQKGTTIRFMSGTNGTTLEFVSSLFWANGEVPTIEPSTHYELSLVSTGGEAYIVLTPFKPVE